MTMNTGNKKGPEGESGPCNLKRLAVCRANYLEEVTIPIANRAATTAINIIHAPRVGLLGTLLLRSTMLSIVGPFHWLGRGIDPPERQFLQDNERK